MVNFAWNTVNRQTEKRISIDKACSTPYRLVYTLVSNGGNIIPISNEAASTNNIVSTPFAIYSGNAHHLSIISEPEFSSIWPDETTTTKLPIDIQPTIGIYDAGHNLAEWISDTPIVASLDTTVDIYGGDYSSSSSSSSSSLASSTTFNPTAKQINLTYGKATYKELRIPYGISASRAARIFFHTLSNVPASLDALSRDNDNALYSITPYPKGLPQNMLATTYQFPIVGPPHSIRWITPPPASLRSGQTFTITAEVLDQYGHRVVKYDDTTTSFVNAQTLPAVKIALSEWNDPRCPIFCAAVEHVGALILPNGNQGTVTKTRGIISFNNIILNLPTNLPSDGSGDSSSNIYKRTVQTILLLEEGRHRTTTGFKVTLTNSMSMAEKEGVLITQANGKITWSYTITAQDITEAQGVIVQQTRSGSGTTSTGTLKYALTGTGTTEIIVESNLDQIFDISADVTVGSTPVVSGNLGTAVTAVTIPNARGTLRDRTTSLSMLNTLASSFEIDSAADVVFDTSTNIILGSNIISSSNINSIVVSTPHHFRLNLNLTSIDRGLHMRDYTTNDISYYASEYEMKERIQAIPHIGQVDVSKVSKNHLLNMEGGAIGDVTLYGGRANYTAWQITFSSIDDDIPPMMVQENNGNADIIVEETSIPKHYKLDLVLGYPLGYWPSRGFRLDY